jgi:hypothetical protein
VSTAIHPTEVPLLSRKSHEVGPKSPAFADLVELDRNRILADGGKSVVHIVYIDDSKQDAVRDKKFQVMGAVIIADELFSSVEQELAYYVYERIPEELRDKCEIHATVRRQLFFPLNDY